MSARGHCGPKCDSDGDCSNGEYCFPTLLNLCDCHEQTCSEECEITFAKAKALISPFFVESDPMDSVEGKPRSASLKMNLPKPRSSSKRQWNGRRPITNFHRFSCFFKVRVYKQNKLIPVLFKDFINNPGVNMFKNFHKKFFGFLKVGGIDPAVWLALMFIKEKSF